MWCVQDQGWVGSRLRWLLEVRPGCSGVVIRRNVGFAADLAWADMGMPPGYAAQGNEFSYQMLMTGNFMLNQCASLCLLQLRAPCCSLPWFVCWCVGARGCATSQHRSG